MRHWLFILGLFTVAIASSPSISADEFIRNQASKDNAKQSQIRQRSQSGSFHVTKDIEYQKIGSSSYRLDLYHPKATTKNTPVVVWIHGGGWVKGTKENCPITWLCDHGYTVASVQYRLTHEAQWPAQIEDCRAAVAFLRKNGAQYKLATDRIGVCGGSAGGHLVALMGTLNQEQSDRQRSGIHAVCDFFGPSDLLTMPNNVLDEGETVADLAKVNGAKLLGGIVRDMPDKAKTASAFHQVSPGDSPTLIIHGDADKNVPLVQSQKLHDKLISAGCQSTLKIIKGAGHGMKKILTSEIKATMVTFFNKHLVEPSAPVKHLFTAKLLLRRLDDVNLSSGQQRDFNELSRCLRTRIDRMRNKVGITKETIKARDKAFSAAKDAKLKGDELWMAVQTDANLTDEQLVVFRKTQEHYADFRKSVNQILTAEQRKKLPKARPRKS